MSGSDDSELMHWAIYDGMIPDPRIGRAFIPETVIGYRGAGVWRGWSHGEGRAGQHPLER